MADLDGTCDERFAAVRDALAESLDNDDVGASVAVFVDGEPVVDLWGGYADADRTRPWERDTITNVWSTTKTMTALCALILADRGELDLDAPVATYWPEFAAAGKEGVLVRHVLGHTAGLPTWDEPMTRRGPLRLADRDGPAGRAGAQLGAGHRRRGYHAVTQGFLVGEVVRRVTGRSLGTFFAEEVAGPLGADFHIGLAAEHDHRVAPSSRPRPGRPEIEARGPGNPPIPAVTANTVAWRRAEIPVRATGSATPAPSPPCSRSSRPAARSAVSACCRRPAANASWRSSSPGRTRSWAHRCGTAWATLSGVAPVPGAVGAVRSSWSTSSST